MTIAGMGNRRLKVALKVTWIAAQRLARTEPGRDSRIVEELRSHILDKASANGEATAAGVDAALAALGRPEDLAREYVTDAVLARAEVSRSPVRILKSLFRWAV